MIYTTQARVEAYLERSLTDEELVLIDEIIEYVSSFISSYTGRTWADVPDDYSEEPEATERLYDGVYSKELFVDDFTDLDKVELLDSQGSTYLTLEDADQFNLYPLNKTVKQSIYLRNYHFPSGSARVRVTAVFGSGAVPADIIMVATSLVTSFLWTMGEAGDFKKESIEGYSYELLTSDQAKSDNAELMKSLDKWKKITL